ncbi:MAG: dihydrofolate reductase [Ferruginibacter sp.]
MISLIVAASENNAIGKDNKLLWNLPNDLKFFKDTTWAMTIIMGRKTYEAIDKPLPGRTNIVVTKQTGWTAENVWVAKDIDDALKQAATTNCKEIFVIGGGEIYRQSMGIADRIYMTRVHANFDADTFFPEMDESKWELKKNIDFQPDEKHAYAYSFQTWERI